MADLTLKVVSSLGWVFANIVTKNVLQFVRTVVLWRILSEDDFGVNGMAWLAINGFVLLQDMGFQSALVQRRKDIEKAISVTWYANVVIRAVVYGILFLVAPAVADYFGEPEVCPILRVASLAVVIVSFSSANEAVLRKNFQFRRILVVDTLDLSVRVGSQITLAVLGFGVWSLVYGHIAGVATRALMLWVIAPIRLGRFDTRVALEMFHFGKHMTLSTGLLWCLGNMDYLFIGKFLGAGALGFYTLARRLAFLVARNVARMLGSVLFPAFSEIGHDLARVRAAWLRSVCFSMVLMTPMAFGMLLFAQELVTVFYPTKLQVVVVPLCILTFSALFRGIGVPLGDLQKGIGKPHLLTVVTITHFSTMLPLLFSVTVAVKPATRALIGVASLTEVESSLVSLLVSPLETWMGLVGASVVITGTTLLSGLGVGLALTAGVVGFKAGDVIKALKPSMLSGCVMLLAGISSKILVSVALPGVSALVRLAVLGPLAVAVYAGALRLFFPSIMVELKELFRQLRRKKGKKRDPLAATSEPGEAR